MWQLRNWPDLLKGITPPQFDDLLLESEMTLSAHNMLVSGGCNETSGAIYISIFFEWFYMNKLLWEHEAYNVNCTVLVDDPWDECFAVEGTRQEMHQLVKMFISFKT